MALCPHATAAALPTYLCVCFFRLVLILARCLQALVCAQLVQGASGRDACVVGAWVESWRVGELESFACAASGSAFCLKRAYRQMV